MDGALTVDADVVCLHNFSPGNLVSVHGSVAEHNKCKLVSTPKETLMFKSKGINGEISHAY